MLKKIFIYSVICSLFLCNIGYSQTETASKNYVDRSVSNAVYIVTTNMNLHTTNNNIHVTLNDKTNWNNKAEISITNGLATTNFVIDIVNSIPNVDVTKIYNPSNFNIWLDGNEDKWLVYSVTNSGKWLLNFSDNTLIGGVHPSDLEFNFGSLTTYIDDIYYQINGTEVLVSKDAGQMFNNVPFPSILNNVNVIGTGRVDYSISIITSKIDKIVMHSELFGITNGYVSIYYVNEATNQVLLEAKAYADLVTNGLSSFTYVDEATNQVLIDAKSYTDLATNNLFVSKLYAPGDLSQWINGLGEVWRSTTGNIGPTTNVFISVDFKALNGTTLSQTVYEWPFIEGDFSGTYAEGDGYYIDYLGTPITTWYAADLPLPRTLTVSGHPECGTAVINLAIGSTSTNYDHLAYKSDLLSITNSLNLHVTNLVLHVTLNNKTNWNNKAETTITNGLASTNFVNSSIANIPPVTKLWNSNLVNYVYLSDANDLVKMGFSLIADGTIWTQSNQGGNFSASAYGNNKFITGSQGSGVYYSSDSINWTQSTLNSGSWASAAYGNGIYVVGCDAFDNGMRYSTNAIDWYVGTMYPYKYVEWRSFSFGNGKFVAATRNGGLYYSTNGADWIASAINSGNYWATSYGNNTYIAAGDGNIFYSTNAINWTSSTNFGGAFTKTTYGNGKFLVSNASHIYSSDNGINWSATLAPEISYTALGYGNGKFLAGSDANSPNNILSSVDGISWSPRVANLNLINVRTFTYGNNKLVTGTASSGIWYSPDLATTNSAIMATMNDTTNVSSYIAGLTNNAHVNLVNPHIQYPLITSLGSMAYQSSNNINVVTGNFQKVYLNLDTSFSNTPPLIPSVYRNLIQSPSIVTVNQDQVIYQVSVDTVNTVSNDVTGLDFSGYKEASWEVWVNYTTTNSLSTIWDSRISWDIEMPELTVTGMYRFVFSSIDGNEIRGKQVYPTVHQYHSLLYAGANGTFNTSLMRSDFDYATTNYVPYRITIPMEKYPYLFFKIAGTSNINKPLTYYMDLGIATQNNSLTKPITTTGQVYTTSVNSTVITKSFMRASTGRVAYIYVENTSPLSIATIIFPEQLQIVRPANELEIKAYNQGWRP